MAELAAIPLTGQAFFVASRSGLRTPLRGATAGRSSSGTRQAPCGQTSRGTPCASPEADPSMPLSTMKPGARAR